MGPKAGLNAMEKRKVLYCTVVYDSFQKFGRYKQASSGWSRRLRTGCPRSRFLIFNVFVKKRLNGLSFRSGIHGSKEALAAREPEVDHVCYVLNLSITH
jgi:hypothetical protein